MILRPKPQQLTQRQKPTSEERIEILEVFAGLPDPRRKRGKRHQGKLCLALFTLAVIAGNRGFLAIGDWLTCYQTELIDLFKPECNRLPSYSTIRRCLLHLNYQDYAACLAEFFGIEPLPGETIAIDGKVLRGSYQLERDNPDSAPHRAIMLVSAYIVERGLILPPSEVESTTTDFTAMPDVI